MRRIPPERVTALAEEILGYYPELSLGVMKDRVAALVNQPEDVQAIMDECIRLKESQMLIEGKGE